MSRFEDHAWFGGCLGRGSSSREWEVLLRSLVGASMGEFVWVLCLRKGGGNPWLGPLGREMDQSRAPSKSPTFTKLFHQTSPPPGQNLVHDNRSTHPPSLEECHKLKKRVPAKAAAPALARKRTRRRTTALEPEAESEAEAARQATQAASVNPDSATNQEEDGDAPVDKGSTKAVFLAGAEAYDEVLRFVSPGDTPPSDDEATMRSMLAPITDDDHWFVPSDKFVTTAIAGARENVNPDKSEQWGFLRQILTSTPLNRRYRVPVSSLAFGRLHPWLSDANNSQTGVTTLLMWTILQRTAMCIDPGSHHTRVMERLFVELLNMGANVGGSDDQARTPLHACIFEAMTGEHPHATGNGFREAREQFPFNLIQSLLVRSASLELRDRSGKTPLEYVLEPGSEDPATIKARATNVARLVLLQVRSVGRGFTSPSKDVKRRLVDRLGVEILAPEDPLKAKLESEGN